MTSTVPSKSQPLHNFALSHLKWKNNHPRGRSSSSSSPHHQSQSPSRSQSPMREPMRQSPLRSGGGGCDGVLEREGIVKGKGVVEHKRHQRNSLKDGVYASDHDRIVEKSERKSSSQPDHIATKDSRTKFLIKIAPGGTAARKSSNKGTGEEGNQEEQKGEEEDEEQNGKTWNLRPRKPIHKSLNVSGGGAGSVKIAGSTVQENKPQSQLPQGNLDNGIKIKSEGESSSIDKDGKKRIFSIPLLKEEIEEDIFVLTGSKPARRPKKRAKVIQKQLENLFPGQWLGLITPDSYKVSENPTKG